MDTDNTILIVPHNAENPNVKVFHSRAELMDKICEYEHGKDTTAHGITGLVLAVPGVVKVWGYPYKLDVLKSPVYTWNEIEAAIVPLLEGLNRNIEGLA